MPAHFFSYRAGLKAARALAAWTLIGAAAPGAWAQAQPTLPAESSPLDAALLYQLLIGEIELQGGEPGTAYQVILDAAGKTRNEQLYKRAIDIALQARAGEQALDAARAWRLGIPESLSAHRYVVQLLVGLNRQAEAVEPLSSLIGLVSAADKAGAIAEVPRYFARVTDRKQAVELVDRIVQPHADAPATKNAAWVAMGRVRSTANDTAGALGWAQTAHKQDPSAEGPVLLALDLMPSTASAEAIVTDHLAINPASRNVRMAYARQLSVSQRYADALAQMQVITRDAPQQALPWLTVGALQLELRQPKEATSALLTYIQRAQAQAGDGAAEGAANVPGANTAATNRNEGAKPSDSAGDETARDEEQGLTQARLLLAQAAEQLGDFKAAEDWLNQAGGPQAATEVQQRRASMLMRQGKVAEARALIAQLPEPDDEAARGKVLIEVQLLRDAKQWPDAYTLMSAANLRFVDDVTLIYEQSMIAEKVNRLDEMERLLRRVIALKPDHHHAHNALGYSLADRNIRLPEAKVLIERAMELAPGEPFIIDSMGWLEFKQGNYAEALRLLSGAYRSRPDPEIGAHLGEVLWVSGQRDEARRVWREARARDGANDVLTETLSRLRVDL